MSAADTNTQVLADLRRRIDTVLRDALAGARTAAYVNFPNHGNAGDPALWLGGLTTLGRLGIRVVYLCEPRTYHRDLLAAADPDVIVINGGGNLGDRYPRQQRGREAVLRDFPHVRTVQLPQSTSFTDPAALIRMQQLVAAHDDLTLLLRDEVSLARCETWFDAPSRRCPDLAFALQPRPRVAEPTHDVLWLARDDKEATGATPQVAGLDAQVTDWLGTIADEPPWSVRARLARTLNQRLTPRVADDVDAAKRWSGLVERTYRPLAQARVLRGMRILARGRVVVTDRLHGHVLSLLQGIEHVVLDNSDGKVRALYDADTHASPLAHLAEDPAQARAKIDEILARI